VTKYLLCVEVRATVDVEVKANSLEEALKTKVNVCKLFNKTVCEGYTRISGALAQNEDYNENFK